ncbi:MAG TPA: alpha/beta hydrolase [Aquihabitans sp.]|jgi:pimeloyl-ACP methyl ester carboxylesterase|nr:alpha/beta hydrolase [Aquihabitans sp.]
MTTRRTVAGAAALVLAATLLGACQPARPATGPGSKAAYIATSATTTDTGSGTAGTRAYTFVPNQLKGGSKAPVVVLLHGFQLLAPDIYQGLVDHLTRQGNIVVFPAYNKGGFGIVGDTDQNAMLARAVASTNAAVDALGAKADRSRVYLFGHSLGGLVASSWTAAGGVAPAGIVLANPSTDAGAGIPAFVRGLVTVTPIPWRTLAPQTTAPTVILTGAGDTIAPPAQATALHDVLTGAPSRAVYRLQGDAHQQPAIQADHMAPIQDQGIVPDAIMAAFGGDAEEDTADWRFYWSALDQLMAGDATPSFAMGAWGDGVAVLPVQQVR